MLYYLLFPLKDTFFGFNVFSYISFRGAGAAITALLISFLIGPKIIRTLSFYQIGETIRKTGPESHLKKEGTPTMGGIIVLLAIILPTILWSKIDNLYVIMILISTIWMGIIGFIDDYRKVILRDAKGLRARYKFPLQLAVATFTAFLVFDWVGLSHELTVPFFKLAQFELGWWYLPFAVCVIVGSSNAVNLTDGLDGLVSMPSIVAFGAYCFLAYVADFYWVPLLEAQKP